MFFRRNARAGDSPAAQRYRLPVRFLFLAIWACVRGRQRDIWIDCRAAINTISNTPIFHGMHNVPESGPLVFLPNHYARKDAVWVGWGAIALTAELARQRDSAKLGWLHWVTTDTWADISLGPFHISPRYLRWIIRGLGDVYGVIRMPTHALPNHSEQRGRSATSLRSIFAALDAGKCVAVHPEAGGFETLVTPPAGVGRVLNGIQRRGVPMIPIGIFEENDHLVINVGEPIAAGALEADDDDASNIVMSSIADLIPPRNRGAYATTDADVKLAAD